MNATKVKIYKDRIRATHKQLREKTITKERAAEIIAVCNKQIRRSHRGL